MQSIAFNQEKLLVGKLPFIPFKNQLNNLNHLSVGGVVLESHRLAFLKTPSNITFPLPRRLLSSAASINV